MTTFSVRSNRSPNPIRVLASPQMTVAQVASDAAKAFGFAPAFFSLMHVPSGRWLDAVSTVERVVEAEQEYEVVTIGGGV